MKLATPLSDVLGACGVTAADDVNEWIRALTRIRRTPGRRPAGDPTPYRGLATFQPEDADWFYGREALIDALVARLRRMANGGLLTVVGASGSGKSSLLCAGLVPAIRSGRLAPDFAGSDVVLLTPGAHPLLEIATTLAAASGDPADAAFAAIQNDPPRITNLIGAVAARHPSPFRVVDDSKADARLVLIVDQFEEVFAA